MYKTQKLYIRIDNHTGTEAVYHIDKYTKKHNTKRIYTPYIHHTYVHTRIYIIQHYLTSNSR